VKRRSSGMKKENTERVLEFTKRAFVFALSSMEHSLKELLKADERAPTQKPVLETLLLYYGV
jgi:hypothetical protein